MDTLLFSYHISAREIHTMLVSNHNCFHGDQDQDQDQKNCTQRMTKMEKKRKGKRERKGERDGENSYSVKRHQQNKIICESY